MQEKVLIVEDEAHARTGLTELVESWGYRAEGANDGIEALERIKSWSPEIVVTDLRMPRMDGMELLNRVCELDNKPYVVMLTAQGSIESAVKAMRIGAWDYLPKPVDPAKLKAILLSASRQRDAENASSQKEKHQGSIRAHGEMIGSTAAMNEVFSMIELVASSNVSVLVTGESGTGKELAARALHRLSSRRSKPLVVVNCAAIPGAMIENEIFGHEKSISGGQDEPQPGCFELAEEGTLLLDEICEMPVNAQAKLLRVLEDRKLRRVGGKTEKPVDVRVVAVTNKDPQRAVIAGELRGDLYYRLNVFNIHMPPLRAHLGDVRALVDKMISDMNDKHLCSVSGISEGVLSKLSTYSWPGNVRELRNVIERSVVVARRGILGVDSLPKFFAGHALSQSSLAHRSHLGAEIPDTSVRVEVGTTVDEANKQLIIQTLKSTQNNKTRAAEILGISTKTLQNKLREYASPNKTY